MLSIHISSFYKWCIKANQRVFLRMAKDIAKGRSVAERCARAQEAATFAVTHTTDIFASLEVEKPFLELAQTINVPLESEYRPGTVLNVMTEAYKAGGHTRCVERWISLMAKQQHSCVILRQNAPFPKQLKEIVERSGGKMYMEQPGEKIVKKAVNLRCLAARFEYVVLHIHMDDPTALIAFGTEEFTRPVIFFNHADHIFWLGVSIAHCVAELNTYRAEISRKYRGVGNSFLLGIPSDHSSILSVTKEEARKKLGISLQCKIIYSGGNEMKYLSVGRPDFRDIVSDLIHREPELQFYIAGINPTRSFWPKLKKVFPDNLHLLPSLDYANEYPLYLAAADLVIDSWPVSGETAAIDAVPAGKPILSLSAKLQADYLVQSAAICSTYDELIEKAQKILHDDEYAQRVYASIYTNFSSENDTGRWEKRCQQLYSIAQKKSHSNLAVSPIPPQDVTLVSLSTCRWTNPSVAADILRRCRRWLIQFRIRKGALQIRLFGMYIISPRISTYETNSENLSL